MCDFGLDSPLRHSQLRTVPAGVPRRKGLQVDHRSCRGNADLLREGPNLCESPSQEGV